MVNPVFKAGLASDPLNIDQDALFTEAINSANFRKLAIELVKKEIKDSGNERVSEAQLQSLGWRKNTAQNYINLNTELAENDITSRNSIIMFMATCAMESDYGQSATEDGDEAYFATKDYSIDERGVGYIQVTTNETHKEFLIAMGDDYTGVKTADHIHLNYNAWQVSAWLWSNKLYGDGNIMNEYALEKALNIRTFLAIQYFINSFPLDSKTKKVMEGFSKNLTGIVNDGFEYDIDLANNKLLVNGMSYRLPNGWEERERAYNRAIYTF